MRRQGLCEGLMRISGDYGHGEINIPQGLRQLHIGFELLESLEFPPRLYASPPPNPLDPLLIDVVEGDLEALLSEAVGDGASTCAGSEDGDPGHYRCLRCKRIKSIRPSLSIGV